MKRNLVEFRLWLVAGFQPFPQPTGFTQEPSGYGKR